MAANNRGAMRPQGRSPPFLAIGLFVALCILGFNYWSLSSRNSELSNEIAELESELRLMSAKKLSAEKRSESTLEKVKELEDLYSRERSSVAKKEADIATLNQMLKQKTDETDLVTQNEHECQTKVAVCEENNKKIEEDMRNIQGQLTKLKDEPRQTECTESSCEQYVLTAKKDLMRTVARFGGLEIMRAMANAGVDVGEFREQAGQQPQNQQPQVQGANLAGQQGDGGVLNMQQQQQQMPQGVAQNLNTQNQAAQNQDSLAQVQQNLIQAQNLAQQAQVPQNVDQGQAPQDAGQPQGHEQLQAPHDQDQGQQPGQVGAPVPMGRVDSLQGIDDHVNEVAKPNNQSKSTLSPALFGKQKALPTLTTRKQVLDTQADHDKNLTDKSYGTKSQNPAQDGFNGAFGDMRQDDNNDAFGDMRQEDRGDNAPDMRQVIFPDGVQGDNLPGEDNRFENGDKVDEDQDINGEDDEDEEYYDDDDDDTDKKDLRFQAFDDKDDADQPLRDLDQQEDNIDQLQKNMEQQHGAP